MVTEFLVGLKRCGNILPSLKEAGQKAEEWDCAVRVPPQRARDLADLCQRLAPEIREFADLVERVGRRAERECEG